ncbi:MAG: TOBE domain-containing protein [Chloracidobacterium sp.]|nr:TOBE domain-containing protein [Chloracidobacterium sp.]
MPLKVSTISKRFSNKWALKDVTFEAADGEIFGFCGPAGSGRSVLLKIIAGKLTPSGGSTVLLPDEPSGHSSSNQPFYVSDDRSEAGLFGRLFGVGKSRRLSPDEVSKTTYEAVRSPAKLIIFDEIFERLGPNESRKQFRALRAAAAEAQKVIVISSSRFELLAEVCDRIAVLSDGEIIQVGPPEELYNIPENASVAETTGRINLIEARRLSSSKDDHPEFQTIVGSHRITAERPKGRRLAPLNRNVQLGIRPENISIAFGASFPEDNSLKAVLEDIRFCGSETLVDCNADGLSLTVAVRRLVGLDVGNECVLGLPPERIILL